jgi:CheY-like chemotaxis protein
MSPFQRSHNLPGPPDHLPPRAHRRDGFHPGPVSGRSALIVEDDYRSAIALTAVLELAALNVLTEASGRAALDTLDERDDIAIVLVDLKMPVMDGYETIAAIRRRPRLADLPIIAVTGKDESERPRCLAAGASDFVRKPIDARTLLAAVSAWMTPESEYVQSRRL